MNSNVAYADFGAARRQERPTVADLDDGYTRLANALYEALIGADLTKNQAKVAHAICRKTYGFGKKSDRIADSQLSELTNLPRQKVNKAKNELIAMRVVVMDGPRIGPNKNVSEWEITGCHYSGDNVTKTVTKDVTKAVTAVSPKQSHTKETITKERKETNPHTPVGGEAEGLVKPKKRRAVKINYDEYLTAYNEEVGDRLPHAIDVTEKRKRNLKKIIPKLATPNVDGWRSYVRAFVRLASPFYFGEGDRGWTADIEYLLKEDTLTAVREGKPSLTGR
ncbi:TPA: replication protein [Morganella morganii]